jgi:hypothetical protein
MGRGKGSDVAGTSGIGEMLRKLQGPASIVHCVCAETEGMKVACHLDAKKGQRRIEKLMQSQRSSR